MVRHPRVIGNGRHCQSVGILGMANPQRASIPLDLGMVDNVIPERIDPTKNHQTADNISLSRGRSGTFSGAPGVNGGESTAITTTEPVCHGIVPHGIQDVAAAYYRPKWPTKRLHPGLTTSLPTSANIGLDLQQNAWFPVEVSDAGVLPASSDLVSALYSCFLTSDNGSLRWYANRKTDSAGNVAWYVTLTDASGYVVASRQFVSYATSIFFALTQHSAGVVLFWHLDAAGGNLQATKLTYTTGVSLVASAPVTIETNVGAGVAVSGDSSTYAYVVWHVNGGADTKITRLTVATNAVSRVTIAGNITGACTHSVSHVRVNNGSGTNTRYVGWSSLSGAPSYGGFGIVDADAMSSLWNQTGWYGTGPANRLSVTFRAYSSSDRCLVVGAQYQFDIWTSPYTKVRFDTYNFGTGALTDTATAYWMKLAADGVTWKADSSGTHYEVYPLYLLERNYAGIDAVDPALSLVVLGKYSDPATPNALGVTPIGRFAVDDYGKLATLHVGDSIASLSYATLGLNNASKRYAVCDLNRSGPSYANINGQSFIAAAQPAIFDGYETVEAGHLYRPRLYGDTGGSGTALAGTTRYRAQYIYTNAAGQRVRSAPSNYVEFAAGVKPRLRVTPPFTMRDGVHQDSVQVLLYSTYWDGATMSSDYYQTNVGWTVAAAYYEETAASVSSGTSAILFSQETSTDELVPDALPAAHDIGFVNDRAWVVLAEHRDQVMLSKRIPLDYLEYGAEFSVELKIKLPAGAGRVTAVRGMGSQPFIFTENAIYTVHGEGPNVTPNDGLYSTPQLVSHYGCVDRRTVVETPAGILFQTGDTFALLSGQGVRLFGEMKFRNVIGAVHHKKYEEVAFAVSVANDGKADWWLVYNYDRDVWTKWNTMYKDFTCPAKGENSTHTWVHFPRFTESGTDYTGIGRMDDGLQGASSVSGTWYGEPSIQTGWFAPAGVNGDCQFHEVWVSGYRDISHGLTISVDYDWNGTRTESRSWTESELSAIGIGANDQYVVSFRLPTFNASAIRVTIVVDQPNGLVELSSLDILYSVNQSQAMRRRILSGAQK